MVFSRLRMILNRPPGVSRRTPLPPLCSNSGMGRAGIRDAVARRTARIDLSRTPARWCRSLGLSVAQIDVKSSAASSNLPWTDSRGGIDLFFILFINKKPVAREGRNLVAHKYHQASYRKPPANFSVFRSAWRVMNPLDSAESSFLR